MRQSRRPPTTMICANAILPGMLNKGGFYVPRHRIRRSLPANPLPFRSWVILGMAGACLAVVAWMALR